MSNEEMARRIFQGLGVIALILWCIFMIISIQWVFDASGGLATLLRFVVFIFFQILITYNLNKMKDLE